MQNELEDALRKRKGPSDQSEEDLGLPSSPPTSQRNGHHVSAAERAYAHSQSPYRMNFQSIQSPSKLLTLDNGGGDMDDDAFASAIGNISYGSNINTSYSSSKLNMSFTSMHTTKTSVASDGEETFGNGLDVGERLSHSAARHKMAIRPKKNVGRRGRVSEGVSSKSIV